VVGEDREVPVTVAGGWVVEACRDGVVEGDGFEEDGGIRVYFSDLLCQSIVEILEFESFGYRGYDKKDILECIAYKWFIDEFVA
jgi:hypothetical protein